MAPVTPFIADDIWRNLGAGRDGAAGSVHLTDYPVAETSARDESLEDAMALARTIVTLGRTIRTDARVKVRQPLARAVVHVTHDPERLRPLLDLIAEELNVKEVELASSAEAVGSWTAKPDFRALGPRLGPRVKEVARALATDDGGLAASLAAGEEVTIETSAGPVTIGPEDVDLARVTTRGWGITSEARMTVALDLDVTPELALEGTARELVRLIQDARRAAGLEVSDRIRVAVAAPAEVARALDRYGEWMAGEVLATELRAGDATEDDAHVERRDVDGASVAVSIRKA